jgi:hypothetical protein
MEKNQVIGPIRLDENSHTLLHVKGWTRRPVISGTEYELRINDVKQKESSVAAMDIYVEWIKDLMKGKRLDFDREVFKTLVEAVGPLYFQAREQSKSKMQKKFWQLEDDKQIIIDDIAARVDAIKSSPFLSIDGQIWTVEQFEQELKVHPLVFRNPKMSKNQFAEQFRLAVADMIRDRYITADAYKKGFDKDTKLKQRYSVWVDNLKAGLMREKILNEAGVENNNDQKIVEEILDPFVTNLFYKYSDQIKINTELFDKIKLNNIDVFVIQENVPFPLYVPGFPQLTTHSSLDFGRKTGGN